MPSGDWICQDCVASKAGKKKRRRRTQAELLIDRAAAAAAASCCGGSSSKADASPHDKAHSEGAHAGGGGADSQNPWALVECQECGSGQGEESIILCDVCDGGYHLECTDPRLKAVPTGEWICKDCSRARKRAQTKKEQDRKYKEFQDRVNKRK